MTPKQPQVRVKRLRPRTMLPHYMTNGAVGLDLAIANECPITLRPGDRATAATGIAVAIPPGYEGQIRPRSGWARRHGVTVLNAPGTVDADYRGEIEVVLVNLGHTAVTISHGDRIAQLVIAPVIRAEIVEVEELESTERGKGGFGSTGRGGEERITELTHGQLLVLWMTTTQEATVPKRYLSDARELEARGLVVTRVEDDWHYVEATEKGRQVICLQAPWLVRKET